MDSDSLIRGDLGFELPFPLHEGGAVPTPITTAARTKWQKQMNVEIKMTSRGRNPYIVIGAPQLGAWPVAAIRAYLFYA